MRASTSTSDASPGQRRHKLSPGRPRQVSRTASHRPRSLPTSTSPERRPQARCGPGSAEARSPPFSIVHSRVAASYRRDCRVDRRKRLSQEQLTRRTPSMTAAALYAREQFGVSPKCGRSASTGHIRLRIVPALRELAGNRKQRNANREKNHHLRPEMRNRAQCIAPDTEPQVSRGARRTNSVHTSVNAARRSAPQECVRHTGRLGPGFMIRG
jgi:hypothetical protein